MKGTARTLNWPLHSWRLAAVSSILRMSRGFQDQMNRIDQRLLGLEKKQDKLSDTLKEINDLVKKIKKDSFCIKGSPYEVCA